MIANTRGSWQTIMADLAIILFMVTASAMGDHPRIKPHPAKAQGGNDQAGGVPLRAEPLETFRPHQGPPTLRDWLASRAHDSRERLTIVAAYAPGGFDAAARQAMAMAGEAAAAGEAARVVLQPSDHADISAVLAFDRGEDWHGDCTAASAKGTTGAPRKDLPCD